MSHQTSTVSPKESPPVVGAPSEVAQDLAPATANDPARQILVNQLRTCFQGLESADEGTARTRIYRCLCSMIDDLGAEPVVESLQALANSEPQPYMTVAGDELRKACQRSQGTAFGRPYDAHMMLMPLIVRGRVPSHFPAQLDHITAIRLHDIVSEVLAQSTKDGQNIYPIPIAFSYTWAEFSSERLTHVHDILRAAFAGVAGHTMESAPKYIIQASPADADSGKRFDDELHDLEAPGIGVRSWKKLSEPAAKGRRAADQLADGDWITMHLIPVVYLVPHGMAPPCVPTFAEQALLVGSVLSFASGFDSDSMKRSESPGISITAAGIFGIDEAASIGRMLVSQSRIISDIMKVLPMMGEETAIHMAYQPDTSCLDVVTADDNYRHMFKVVLPRGVLAQQYAESLARDFQNIGLPVDLNMGDRMIRMGGPESLALH